MTREIELRLIGHDADDGEIRASDAVALIEAVRNITYRLTRLAAERPGLGRAAADLERLAEVRVGLRTGSTRVVFTVGDATALAIDPLAEHVDQAFWDIVAGMQTNRRPRGVSDTVADAVDDLVVALHKAAPTVEVSVAGREPLELTTRDLSRGPWRPTDELPQQATLHGTLEMVDARSGRFRIRDAVQNAVDLIDVHDPEIVAPLVTQTVTAAGLFVRGEGTRHHRLEDAVVTAASVEERLGLDPGAFDLRGAATAASTAPVSEPVGLSDDELDDFLAAIRA